MCRPPVDFHRSKNFPDEPETTDIRTTLESHYIDSLSPEARASLLGDGPFGSSPEVKTPQDEQPEDETEDFTISIDHTPSALVPIPALSSEVIEYIQENESLRNSLPATFHEVETDALPDYRQYANFWIHQSQNYKNRFLALMGGNFLSNFT